MDQQFKRLWDEFLETQRREFTRLDKELAHKFFVLGRDGRFPDQPAPSETSPP